MTDAIQQATYALKLDDSQYTGTSARVTAVNESMAGSFEKLEAKADAAIAIEQRRQAANLKATQIAEAEGISLVRLNAIIDANNAKALQAAITTTQAAQQMDKAWGVNRGSLLSLQAAGINAGQALASGMSIGRVAMTEGAQVVGALAGAMTGNLALAISAIIAGLSILASSTGIFSNKGKEATDTSDNLANSQRLLSSAFRETTKEINDSIDALDRYGMEVDKLNTGDLLRQGEKLNQLLAQRDVLAQQLKADAASGYGTSAEGQKELDRLNALVKIQQDRVQAISTDIINFSKQHAQGQFETGVRDITANAAKGAQEDADKNRRQLEKDWLDFELDNIDATADAYNKANLDSFHKQQDLDKKAASDRKQLSKEQLAFDLDLLDEKADAYNKSVIDEQNYRIKVLTANMDTEDNISKQAAENWNSIAQDMADAQDSILGIVNGTLDWKQALMGAVSWLEKQLLQLKSLGGGGGGIFDTGGPLGIIGNLLGGMTGALPGLGGSLSGPGALAPLFAEGGDFTVGGSGGTDSQVVRFMATPGEKVSVRTPQQANDSGGGVSVVYNVHVAGDADEAKIRRALAEATPGIVKASVGATQRAAGRSVTGANAWTRHA